MISGAGDGEVRHLDISSSSVLSAWRCHRLRVKRCCTFTDSSNLVCKLQFHFAQSTGHWFFNSHTILLIVTVLTNNALLLTTSNSVQLQAARARVATRNPRPDTRAR